MSVYRPNLAKSGRLVYAINGIRSSTDEGQWYDAAEKWFELNTEAKATGYRYSQSALREHQDGHVQNIADDLSDYQCEFLVDALVHSDGSTKLCCALERNPTLKIGCIFIVEGGRIRGLRRCLQRTRCLP